MTGIKLLIGTTAILLASAFTIIKSVNWKVKDDYSVKFYAGTFGGLKATILFDEANPEKSTITASIDAGSVNTGNGVMNAHAKEKEALYTAKFPVITFVSTAIKKTSSGYEATGNLTLKGITKEIKLPFNFNSKKTSDKFPFVMKENFNGAFTIVTKDFNVTREGTPAQVRVELDIPVTQ
jgi:polyisoprenoid-binding protein YceI